MTDRELLEAAAKAAGYKIHESLMAQRATAVPDAIALALRAPGNNWWNPLEDDADALRLAVKLGIHISQQLSYCAAFCPHGDNSTRGTTWTEQYNADPAAATRRAIVRAAAAMAE